MRAVSGLISKNDPSDYKVFTATATIGIRGTGFDLVWLGSCPSAGACGLIAHVWDGSIFAENDIGRVNVEVNQTVRVADLTTPTQFIATPPVFTVPRPDQVDVNFDELFGAESRPGAEPGLYVACYDGHCSMSQEEKTIDLGAGEAGFASIDGQQLVRFEQIKPFQANDPYLNTINELFDSLYELLDDNAIEETEFECVIQ